MRRGFTLFEVMMVVSILAIVASVVVPLVGNNEASQLRAAAELLAADIEDIQARALAEPEAPGCILLEADGSGWRLAQVDAPEDAILDFEGRPLRRAFGSDVLAGCPDLRIMAMELPSSGLQFNDQGTPMALDTSLVFELEAGDREDSITVAVSASTGRVSINRN